MRTLAAIMTSLGALTWAPDALAQDADVLAMARSVAYDRKLRTRCGSELNVWVVYAAGDEASKAQADRVAKSLDALGFTIGGLQVHTRLAEVSDAIWPQLADADALFIASGLNGHLPALLAATQEHDALSMSFDLSYAESGVSLSLLTQPEGRFQMVVNLPTSREEGVVFNPALLELARVIR